MYKAVLNFLRGQVLVHIESGCPERVVNLCAGAEVPFWDVRWLSPVELTLRTTRRGLAQVRQAARQVGAAATVRREQGAPLLARRLRRRYVLLAGLLLTVLLVLEGNFTIWEFRVSGNETVPDEVILRALEDYGITIGTRSLDIDQKDMRSHVLLELKDVVWLAALRLTARLTGLSHPLLSGAVELTQGILALPATPTGFVWAAALLGWGGLSVHGQSAAVLSGTDLPLGPYLAAKAAQAALSALLAWPVSRYLWG